MVTRNLSDLAERRFDVVVIGAGVNGSSAARHLAAAGYSVLIVDKSDFAAGSSSRSSRLLHCGLRYLAPGVSMFEFVRHPRRLLTACRMARQAMNSRSHFVATMPERVRRIRFNFPLYTDSPYAAWQLDSAFRLLYTLGPKDVPLDYRRLKPEEIAETPLLRELRDPEYLKSVGAFREYQFDWPERVVIDNVLDAERMGAVARNYTAAVDLVREQAWWELGLKDELDETQSQITVRGRAIVNMAGVWIDEVNRLSRSGKPRRQVTGTKGTHIAVELPPECSNFGIATLNRDAQPFYCVPWRGLHYFGPTETLYDLDLESIRPTEEEVSWLLDEANHLLPAFNLTRRDVVYAWAGVRPLTYDPQQPMGARSRELRDLTEDGLTNVLTMTAGPVMTHQSAGEEVVEMLADRVAPSCGRKDISYSSVSISGDTASAPLIAGEDSVRLTDVYRAAADEHAQTLIDALFRRTGSGWHSTMALGVARNAAEVMADVHGWDDIRVAEEVRKYKEYVRVEHLHRDCAS